MPYRAIIALAAMAICLTLTGCTTTSQGLPVPQTHPASETGAGGTSTGSAPPSSSASNGDLPSDGAPKVRNPLDTSRYQQNPCQMLMSEHLQQLNLPTQGKPGQGPLGLECDWLNQETGASAGIEWADKNPRGLSSTYAARKSGRYAYFIELGEIEGYPAVAADLSDARDTGTCVLTVGVSDQLIFLVSVQLSLRNIEKKDPCKDGAVAVAAMMLQTMKAGK
jgi:hypothetical protein